jgi:N-carbamoyl-L-amino-acid hydrolase
VAAWALAPLSLPLSGQSAGGTAAPASSHRMSGQEPRIDGARLMRNLERLATFGAGPGGTSRHAFSEADRAAREVVAGWMREAGLAVETDAAANLVGHRPGAEALPPLMIGSHIDTVPNAGNYDGPVGALGAVEVAHTLHAAGTRVRHPLEVVIFSNEEGGKTGSRAVAGEVTDRDLGLPTASGRTIGDGMRYLGGDPDAIPTVRRTPGAIAGFLELHIEQGSILHQRGIDIGVVEGIVGIRRWNVTVEGFANHAGTTPMNARRDALLAAARWIDATNRAVRSEPGRHVATVGRVSVEPNAPNVIPGRVVMSLEIRDLDMPRIDELFAIARAVADPIAAENEVSFRFEEFYVSAAAPTAESMRVVIEEAAARLGLSTLRLPSGAGHDAQSIAQLAPVGMIFVPSIDGISHSPAERTPPEAIANGANVLLHSLLALDRAS